MKEAGCKTKALRRLSAMLKQLCQREADKGSEALDRRREGDVSDDDENAREELCETKS